MASSSVRSSVKNGPPPRNGRVNGAAGRQKAAPPADDAAIGLLDEDDDDELETATAAADAEATQEAAADDTGGTYKGKGEDFWEWLTQFSTDQWQFMMGYLYRTAPTIDRRAAGRPTNIRKYSVPFDQDTVMHDFRGQHFVENANDRFPIRFVGAGDCALLHVLAGALAELLNIGHERLVLGLSGFRSHGFG